MPRTYSVKHSFDVDLEPNGDIFPTLKLIVGDTIIVDARQIRLRDFTEMMRSQTTIVLAKRKGWIIELAHKSYTAMRSFTIGRGTDREMHVSKGDILEYDGLVLKYQQRVEVSPNLRIAIERGYLELGVINVDPVKRPRDLTVWERSMRDEL